MLPRRWPHDRGRFPQSNAAAQSFPGADVGPENTGSPNRTYNEIQSDEVRFDLQFHAQQCRHNDDPTNPYAE